MKYTLTIKNRHLTNAWALSHGACSVPIQFTMHFLNGGDVLDVAIFAYDQYHSNRSDYLWWIISNTLKLSSESKTAIDKRLFAELKRRILDLKPSTSKYGIPLALATLKYGVRQTTNIEELSRLLMYFDENEVYNFDNGAELLSNARDEAVGLALDIPDEETDHYQAARQILAMNRPDAVKKLTQMFGEKPKKATAKKPVKKATKKTAKTRR